MQILLLALTLLSCNAWADWSTSVVKDEMRGTETEVTDTLVSPINGDGPKLYVSIVKPPESGQKISISFRLDAARQKIDCKDSCNISMRFDDFKVIKQTFIRLDSGDFITPNAPLSLIRAMSLADIVYVEIPLADGSTQQYKMNTHTLNKSIGSNPQSKIFNLVIGADMSTLPSSFTPYGDGKCYTANDVPLTEGFFKVSKVSACLVKGKIATVIFTVSDKKQKKSLYGYLTKAFGSRYEVLPGNYSWPDEKYRINYNTVRTGMIGDTFVVSDGISDYFNK